MRINYFVKCAAGLLLLATATLTQAMPAKRGQWQTLTLADGTTVTAQLMGNEHLHYYQTADGQVYTATEVEGIYQKTSATLLEQRAQWRAPRRSSGRRKEFGVPTHYTGSKKGIIILVNFKDVKFKTANNKARYNAIANQENYSASPFTGSVHDYFLAQSYNQFDLTFDVLGPVQLSNNRSYYGADSGGEGNDVRPGHMVKEACEAVNDEVTWSDYDWDGDGEVDQVFILYAGQGQADGGAASTIWPHEWLMTEAYGSKLKLQNTYIDTYACGPELNGYSQINGIGTICHEFTHCLGIPDFYDTEGSNYGMGSWSLMDYGCYNNSGYTPCDYTGYERWFCGWIEPIVIEGGQTLQVQGMKSISSSPEVYLAYNPATDNEYYMLQNIQQEGWNAYAPDEGLLVMHIDYNKNIWQLNTVNNTSSRQRCTIVPADNSLTGGSESGDCYPNGSKKALGNSTTPAAKLYNANTNGTKLLNVEFTNITMASNGTISFKAVNNNEGSVTPPDPDPDPDPDPVTGDIVFYESFDQCSGTGGNDGLWSDNVASASFVPDNAGWVANKSYGGNQCARFGTTSSNGQLIMPAFTMPAEGEVVLTFLAAPWSSKKDGTGLLLEVVEGSASLSESEFTLTTGEWTNCETTITGSGTVQLQFTPVQRWFLDEVKVCKVTGEVTGIVAIDRNPNAGNVWFDLSGRRVTTPTHPGIYVVNGRKYVRK